MSSTKESALNRFVAATRGVYADEKNEEKRWERIVPLLSELLADPDIRARSRDFPNYTTEDRAANLLFYEDPDYGFVINGLIKTSKHRTAIHDHGHVWTLYGVIDGHENIERYERLDDGSKPDYAEVRQTQRFEAGPGEVDLVPPGQIHAEESGEERTVAIMVRSARVGQFPQGRYDPTTKRYWQGYGPKQIPYELD